MKRVISFSFIFFFLLFGLWLYVFATHIPSCSLFWVSPPSGEEFTIGDRIEFAGHVSVILSGFEGSEECSADLDFFIEEKNGGWYHLDHWSREGKTQSIDADFGVEFTIPPSAKISSFTGIKIHYRLGTFEATVTHHNKQWQGDLVRAIKVLPKLTKPEIVVEPYVWVDTTDLTIPDYNTTCIDPLSGEYYDCAWNPAETSSFPSGYSRDPYPSDDLLCKIKEPSSVNYSDGLPIKYTYKWYKNGRLQSYLTKSDTTDLQYRISSANTSLGDQWKCEVTPKDNLGFTGPSGSYTVTIVSPPSSSLRNFERFVEKTKDFLSYIFSIREL